MHRRVFGIGASLALAFWASAPRALAQAQALAGC